LLGGAVLTDEHEPGLDVHRTGDEALLRLALAMIPEYARRRTIWIVPAERSTSLQRSPRASPRRTPVITSSVQRA
jgi:hypothetical protein